MVKDGVFVMIPNPHHGEKISIKLQQIILKETGISKRNGFQQPDSVLVSFQTLSRSCTAMRAAPHSPARPSAF